MSRVKMTCVVMTSVVLTLAMCATNVEARGRRMMQQQQVYQNWSPQAAPAATYSVPATAGTPVQTGTIVQMNGVASNGSAVVQANSIVNQSGGTVPPTPGTAAHGSAQWKAEQSARIGSVQHLGGGFGGGSYEGNGFAATADQAIRGACFWGQRTPIEIGVARGANGYYATIFYR